MASEKLTATRVARARVPGMTGDGGGLWLRITAGGSKGWIFRFMLAGRSRAMGLGSVNYVTLAEARELARQYRKLVKQGLDPIEARRAESTALQLEAARAITFEQCADYYIIAHQAEWEDKTANDWAATLKAYVFPVFGALPIQAVDTALVMKAIEPLWLTKLETARRIRGRIESILDWAAARGYRVGENPARWRGHLENLLAKRSKVHRVKHHAALPFVEIAAFITELRHQQGAAARALEFAVLTGARSDEALGATWDEVDFAEKHWTIPGERMKGEVTHRVPLSDRAIEILGEMHVLRQSDLVFPGRGGGNLSHFAMRRVLAAMDRDDLTVHGFRSTFRDWASECTNFPREVCEAALAHAIESKVEAAYRRGDLFQKRRQLMAAWARYCAAPAITSTGKVVGLAAAGQ
jgi:integrase